MRHELPPAFFACLAAAVAGGGLTLWMVGRLLARARLRGRLFKAHADETGSAVVEFPFALIVLVMLVCLTSQFAFMTTAYLVVDYAAFAAVRAAIVPVQDGPGTPSDPDLDAAQKAAALVVYPVSGNYAASSAWDTSGVTNQLSNFHLPLDVSFIDDWAADVRALAGQASFVTRYVYARQFTEVEKASGAPPGAVTVDVTHWYSLAIPYADRILAGRKNFIAGYQTRIRARATMLLENQTEKLPPKPTDYAAPPQGGG